MAQGHRDAAILQADAIKESKIREAQGEAEAILTVQQAYANSLRMLTEADPSAKVIQLKSFEALQKVAEGKATKIIVPSDIQNLAGLVTSIKEVANTDTMY